MNDIKLILIINSETSAEKVDPSVFNNVQNLIIGSNEVALNAAKLASEKLGYSTVVLTSSLKGEAAEMGRKFAKFHGALSSGSMSFYHDDEQLGRIVEKMNAPLLEAASKSKFVLVTGGETTVTVKGSGIGGRSQELALAWQIEMIDQLPNIKGDVTFASASTDGQDGPTDAAGAIVSTFHAKELSNDAELFRKAHEYLKNNDTYNWFTNFSNGDCLLKPGLTGTNVMDIQIAIFNK